MLHRLCGPPSIPLSFNLAVVLPRRVLNALAAALSPGKGPTPSTHRLRRGLPGYLILFAPPRFRASASVTDQRAAFATGVPPYIYAFHRYTWNSTLPSALKLNSFQSVLWLSHSL